MLQEAEKCFGLTLQQEKNMDCCYIAVNDDIHFLSHVAHKFK